MVFVVIIEAKGKIFYNNRLPNLTQILNGVSPSNNDKVLKFINFRLLLMLNQEQ
jgi:hypothetical protein